MQAATVSKDFAEQPDVQAGPSQDAATPGRHTAVPKMCPSLAGGYDVTLCKGWVESCVCVSHHAMDTLCLLLCLASNMKSAACTGDGANTSMPWPPCSCAACISSAMLANTCSTQQCIPEHLHFHTKGK